MTEVRPFAAITYSKNKQLRHATRTEDGGIIVEHANGDKVKMSIVNFLNEELPKSINLERSPNEDEFLFMNNIIK